MCITVKAIGEDFRKRLQREKLNEKMDLDKEVTKLKMSEANQKSSRYCLEDKVAKTYPDEIARTENLSTPKKNS